MSIGLEGHGLSSYTLVRLKRAGLKNLEIIAAHTRKGLQFTLNSASAKLGEKAIDDIEAVLKNNRLAFAKDCSNLPADFTLRGRMPSVFWREPQLKWFIEKNRIKTLGDIKSFTKKDPRDMKLPSIEGNMRAMAPYRRGIIESLQYRLREYGLDK